MIILILITIIIKYENIYKLEKTIMPFAEI